MKTKDGHTALFLNVKYDDVDPKTYKGISLRLLKGREKIFNTKNPTFDLACASIYAHCMYHGPTAMLMYGSSIDHFDMDGGEIDTSPPTEMYQIAKDYLISKNILPSGKIRVK